MSIAPKIVANLRSRLTDSQLTEVADILAIAERYKLLDGIASAHVFELVDGADSVGLALGGHGLTVTQHTYSPEGPSPDTDGCPFWTLGNLRLVFIDLDRREHVTWLLRMAERQEGEHERPAARIAA